MGIYLGASELGGGSSGGGGYVPGIIGFEFLALSGGGSGNIGSTYGGGGGGGGTLINSFAYTHLDRVIPITVGAGGTRMGGTTQYSGGSSVLGDSILVTTILGGGGGTYSAPIINDFGTCAGGQGSTSSSTVADRRYGNGFDNKGRIIGVLETADVIGSAKNINDTTTPFTNGKTNAYSGPGGAGLGGSAPDPAYNTGNIGGIGLDPTTITDRFLTQTEFISEGIGEVTSSVAYIGGGGSGNRSSGRANPPGGCGAANVAGLANTGGGGGSGDSSPGNGGSGFVMLRLPTSQSVTTTGTVSTYTKGTDTVYVWKSTGSITLNS